jgi:hypothetical protein
MSRISDVVARHLPKKVRDGQVVANNERAEKILDELKGEGFIVFSPEIRTVVSNALNMLIDAGSLTPDDRRRIAQSAMSTVWGGFFPIEDDEK